MEVHNSEGKKKRRVRFAILYGVSIAMLAIIFAALWKGNASETPHVLQKISAEDTEKISILGNDMKLHVSMQKLDELNMQYLKQASDSANKTSLDSINNLISVAENNMSSLLAGMNTYYSDSLNNEKSDSMIAAYTTALRYRKMLGTIRLAVAAKGTKNMDAHDMELLQLKMDVQDKQNVILDLQRQLATRQNSAITVAPTAAQPPQQTEKKVNDNAAAIADANIKKQRDSINILLALYSSVAKDNSNLINQVKDLKANTHHQDLSANPSQISVLSNQIDDLNAQLVLANVDCNLTRANGKDVIYTSRQRKELLQQSLKSLTDLSASSNETIKKLARERMIQLKSIADNVHD